MIWLNPISIVHLPIVFGGSIWYGGGDIGAGAGAGVGIVIICGFICPGVDCMSMV